MNISKAKDMGGIGQGKEKTKGKNVQKTTQNIKMNKCKKSWQTGHLDACPYTKRWQTNLSRGMMTKEQRSLKGIKRINKWEKLKQLASHHSKFLEHGLKQDGVENIRYLHLKPHLIKMDIQNSLNTMNQNFATTLNHHTKLMWQ